MCKRCGFDDTIKHGVRKNKYFQKQVYLCKKCNSFFSTSNSLLNNSIYPTFIIKEVFDHFCEGKPYAEIARLINEKEKTNLLNYPKLSKHSKLSKSTVHRWVQIIKRGKWQK